MKSYSSVTIGKYQLTEAFIFTGFLALFVSFFLLQSQINTEHMVAAVQQTVKCKWDTSIPASMPQLIEPNILQNGTIKPNSNTNSSPPNWSTNSWGNNESHFSYVTSDGYNDNTSLKVEMQNHQSGDAKWAYDQPIAASSLTAYLFSAYYKSNVETQAVAEIFLKDGSKQYINLGLILPSNEWKRSSFTFVTPKNAQQINAFLVLYQNGYLQTDNYHLSKYQAKPLPQALISLTFDDGAKSIYHEALPLLQQHQIPSTQYVVTGPLVKPYEAYYINANELKSFLAQGHEIASHSHSHISLPDSTNEQINYELLASQYDLYRIIGQPITNFAAPYGRYNHQVVSLIKQHYCSHRSTDAGYNSPDYFDLYNIRVKNIESTTSVNTVKSWINYANTHKVWLVLVFHEIEDNGGKYSYSPQNFKQVLEYINHTDIKPVTMSQAIPIMQSAQKQLNVE